MRKSSKLQSILYLLLIIILLAVAVGGVSNLRNSIDEAFNNGGGSSSNTTQATDNSTANVPVTTVPVTGNGVGVHTCEWDYSKPSNPQANDPHYTVYPCKYPSCSNFKAKYTQCTYDETCYCVICGAEGPHNFVEDYGGTAGNHTVVEKCSICGKGGSVNSVGISCVDNNKDGLCDLGGCTMPTEEPEHVHSYSNVTGYCSCGAECSHNIVTGYNYQSDGQHSTYDKCSICDKSFGGSIRIDCSDSNNDGLCDDCKHEIEEEHVCSYGSDGYCSCGEQCSHSTTYERYSTQGSEHTVDTLCSTCGYLVKAEGGVPCTGEDCFVCEQLNN